MVDGGYEGDSESPHEKVAVTQALVVVDDVEPVVSKKGAQPEECPEAECSYFRKHTHTRGHVFISIQRAYKCLQGAPGDYGGGGITEIKLVWHTMQYRPVHHEGIWRPNKYMDMVSESDEFLGHVLDVDPLASAIWISPVTKKTYSK
jgi:hypothetical protein